jgi:hypothetical protein
MDANLRLHLVIGAPKRLDLHRSEPQNPPKHSARALCSSGAATVPSA